MLLRFLLSLKTAVEDEMVTDLVVNVFKVCPDLLNRYFKESQYSFVPRLKTAWLDNMKLVRKVRNLNKVPFVIGLFPRFLLY